VDPFSPDPNSALTTGYLWRPRPKFQDRVSRHVILLVLTVVSTTLAGANHYANFLAGFSPEPPSLPLVQLLLGGIWYSGTILAILGSHELGHYFACRYYDVDASLPFFLPVPIVMTGTLGAFIRIREPIPSKRMLFDIGVAGPIAGFLVAVPALFVGMAMSTVVALPDPLPPSTVELGEPLLYKAAAWLIVGTTPQGYTVNMHPVAFAAWFGLLATALNLFPIGQLDGGHIAYAVLGRRSSLLTLGAVALAIVLAFFSASWIVWTVLMVVMLVLFGRHHPRTYDEEVPLDASRQALAVFALAMFVLCFSPAPIEPIDVLTAR